MHRTGLTGTGTDKYDFWWVRHGLQALHRHQGSDHQVSGGFGHWVLEPIRCDWVDWRDFRRYLGVTSNYHF